MVTCQECGLNFFRSIADTDDGLRAVLAGGRVGLAVAALKSHPTNKAVLDAALGVLVVNASLVAALHRIMHVEMAGVCPCVVCIQHRSQRAVRTLANDQTQGRVVSGMRVRMFVILCSQERRERSLAEKVTRVPTEKQTTARWLML